MCSTKFRTANHESSSGTIPNELFRSPAAYMKDKREGIAEQCTPWWLWRFLVVYPNWLEFMVINFLRKHNSYSGLPRQKLCSRTFQMKYSSRLGYTLNNAGISKSTRGGPPAAAFITRYIPMGCDCGLLFAWPKWRLRGCYSCSHNQTVSLPPGLFHLQWLFLAQLLRLRCQPSPNFCVPTHCQGYQRDSVGFWRNFGKLNANRVLNTPPQNLIHLPLFKATGGTLLLLL